MVWVNGFCINGFYAQLVRGHDFSAEILFFKYPIIHDLRISGKSNKCERWLDFGEIFPEFLERITVLVLRH
jgi:hypothetical protein